MIRCLIVEDEPLAADILQDYISQLPFLELKATCTDAIYALDVLKKEKIDLIFLDIHLPGLKGLEFLKTLAEPPRVILTTAYHEYALESYELSVVDYLLKPIDGDELEAAIQRASERIKTKKSSAQNVEVLLQNLRGGQSESMQMALPTQEGIFYVPIREIVRCESDANYTIFHFIGRKKIMVSKNLKEYEELLSPYGFVRVHNQYLINLRQVKKYIKGEGGTVVMNDDAQIEVARRRKEVFLAELSKLTIR